MFTDECEKIARVLEQLGPAIAKAVAQVNAQLERDLMAGAQSPIKNTSEAELLVRLEEILEGPDYDMPMDFERIQTDMQALAFGLLLLLRREENNILGNRHVYDSNTRCMRCGKYRAEVEMPGDVKICTGGV
jgi:hypothetical protein